MKKEEKECPICKNEMNEYWRTEFDYIIGIDDESSHWENIKNNVKEKGFICSECNLKIIGDEE